MCSSDLPVPSLLQWENYLTFGERGIVISGKYKKTWNYSIGFCIAQLAGQCIPFMGVLFKSVLLNIPVVNLWML